MQLSARKPLPVLAPLPPIISIGPHLHRSSSVEKRSIRFLPFIRMNQVFWARMRHF